MKLLRVNTLLFVALFVTAATAQVKTETSKSQGQATVQTKVERGEVITVSGNDLVVKMDNGEIRNFPNVPESARVTVNGQQLSVHDLKPGMKLERTVTTTTTPETITTVKTVTGTIHHVSPPSTLILTLEDGTNEKFTIPQGQKFNVDGHEKDAWGLRKGMKVSATKIVTEPSEAVTQSSQTTGQMPAPPAEAIQGPLLIEHAKPAEQAKPAEEAKAQPPAKQLPQTASTLPFFALMGLLFLVSGAAAFAMRFRTR